MALPVNKMKVAAVTVLVMTGLCTRVWAQVFLEDGKVKLSVVPGQTVTGHLTLHNTTDKDVDMRVYWEDFEYKPPFDGSKEFMPKGTSPDSGAGWVNWATNTLMFGPYAKRTIAYTVNVPENFDKGHYGVLFFENEDNGQVNRGDKTLNVVTRVGCLFFIEPKAKDKTVRLEDFSFSDSTLTGTMTNAGNVIVIPEGSVYVIDQEGSVYDRSKVGKLYLPPGESAEYSLAFDPDLDPGRYTAVLTVNMEDDDVFVKEIDFQKGFLSEFQLVGIRD